MLGDYTGFLRGEAQNARKHLVNEASGCCWKNLRIILFEDLLFKKDFRNSLSVKYLSQHLNVDADTESILLSSKSVFFLFFFILLNGEFYQRN